MRLSASLNGPCVASASCDVVLAAHQRVFDGQRGLIREGGGQRKLFLRKLAGRRVVEGQGAVGRVLSQQRHGQQRLEGAGRLLPWAFAGGMRIAL